MPSQGTERWSRRFRVPSFSPGGRSTGSPRPVSYTHLDVYKRQEEAIAQHSGQMARTARGLDLERSHLYKKARSLGILLRGVPESP